MGDNKLIKLSADNLLEKAGNWFSELDPAARNALVGAGLGGGALALRRLLSSRDEDHKNKGVMRQALLGALLGGVTGGAGSLALGIGNFDKTAQVYNLNTDTPDDTSSKGDTSDTARSSNWAVEPSTTFTQNFVNKSPIGIGLLTSLGLGGKSVMKTHKARQKAVADANADFDTTVANYAGTGKGNKRTANAQIAKARRRMEAVENRYKGGRGKARSFGGYAIRALAPTVLPTVAGVVGEKVLPDWTTPGVSKEREGWDKLWGNKPITK